MPKRRKSSRNLARRLSKLKLLKKRRLETKKLLCVKKREVKLLILTIMSVS